MASSASLDELQKKFDGNQRRYLAPLANEYRKTGDLERAIELCRAHLPEYPEHLSGYVVFGQALYEAGRLDEASEAFTTALSLDPENLIALRHLGDIARDRGDREGARDWYQRVLDADPRNETIAAAMQSLEQMSGSPPAPPAPPAPPRAASGTPMSSTAFEAPSLGFGTMAGRPGAATPASVTPASVTPQHVSPQSETPQSVTPLSVTPQELPALEEPHLETADARAPEAADDAIDFDPGFFSAGTESSGAGTETESAPDAQVDIEEPALDAGHDVDPSELALAAALDVPIIDEPAPPALDADAAFDFQATSLDDEADASDASDDEGSRAWAATPAGEYGDVSLDEPEATPSASTPPADAGDDEPEPYTPAYGGGFDANTLFADPAEGAPPAVTPPADLGLESMEFVPPPRAASETPSGATPFVTETMAELYLQQGFREEALEVYEQLLAASPGDDELRQRVERVRRGDSTGLDLSGSYAVSEPTASPTDATASTAAPAAAPSAREFFASLARRGGAPDGSPDPGTGGAPHEPQAFAPSYEQDGGAATAVATASDAPEVDGDSLAQLFGTAAANEDDEQAASALASLIGDGSLHGDAAPPEGDAATSRTATPPSVPAMTSAPSRPAARELSLDDVFGAPRPQARPTPNSTFSFDQFFADSQAADPAPATNAEAPSQSAPADESKDLEQFNSWLEGLKKR